MLLLTGVFMAALIAGLRGSVRDAALEVLGVALAVTAAILITHQLRLPDGSGGFFLAWFLCFAVGLAPLMVMAAIYGQQDRRAANSGALTAGKGPPALPLGEPREFRMRRITVRLRGCARNGALVLAMGALAEVLLGCGGHPPVRASTAAPPWRVCGQTLYSAPNGAVVLNAQQWPSRHPITHLSAQERLYLRVARGCSQGVEVEFVPDQAATISKAVRGKHGLIAVVVRPHDSRFAIRLANAAGSMKLFRVRIH